MNIKQFRIKTVDRYGFLGRDHHPRKSDEDLVVTAVKMETEFHEHSGGAEPFLGEDGRIYDDALAILQKNMYHSPRESGSFRSGLLMLGREDELSAIVQCWTCVTEDGRVLELMGHELEEVS